MKRRRFLKQAGLAAAGSPILLARADQPARRPDGVESRPAQAKRLLITGGESRLVQALAAGLGGEYRVQQTGMSDKPGSTRPDYTLCRLEHDDATRALVRGMEAVVHLAELPPNASAAECMDCRTRLTYNLLWAAAEEGARLVVYFSSLGLMTGYDEAFAVDEDWRPRPTDDPAPLSHYLGEFTCREFAREGRLRVVALRLDKVVSADETAGQHADPLWVDQRDVVQAVSHALAAGLADPSRLGPWTVLHIVSGSPQARFSIDRAKRLLGYQPQFNFSG